MPSITNGGGTGEEWFLHAIFTKNFPAGPRHRPTTLPPQSRAALFEPTEVLYVFQKGSALTAL